MAVCMLQTWKSILSLNRRVGPIVKADQWQPTAGFSLLLPALAHRAECPV